MNIFDFRDGLIEDYVSYIKSFIHIRDERIRETVEQEQAILWPQPLIQLNPSFEPGEWIDDLVATGVLHPGCGRIFRQGKDHPDHRPDGLPLRLHRHQSEAVRLARTGRHYVLTTGTGSGKSLAYLIPIVDFVLRHGSGRGIQAIVVYPMNALANSQCGELEKFLCLGYPEGGEPAAFARYTGQEGEPEREAILQNPPDILLTNYMMLELILTRPRERRLVEKAQGLRFLVLDELHIHRGRQGADVSLLVRRVRDRLAADALQCVGTSATLAGSGSYAEQQAQVAQAASLLFGDEVRPDHVIGETLQRVTPSRRHDDPAFREQLAGRVGDLSATAPQTADALRADPLASWIESTFGVNEDEAGERLVRATPRSAAGDQGAARELSQLTRVPETRCEEAIRKALLAGHRCRHPETGLPLFAFRLHQFISKGDAVFASLEPEPERHVTLNGQQFVPGDRTRLLLPLVFCRECGQEYYCVWQEPDEEGGGRRWAPRWLADGLEDEGRQPGFLYLNTAHPWPRDTDGVLEKLPDDWLREGRLMRSRADHLPRPVRARPDGCEREDGLDLHFLPAPFRFCLHCGVSYDFRQRTDFGKLASLSSEGRSTATTILSLAAIRHLKREPHESLPPYARKLLSFTDNRQDASLQAGHFNDFIQIGLLRSALWRAVNAAGEAGLRHEELTLKVFEALDLPTAAYAADPNVRFAALEATRRALREVLGYRLYHDLRRGWRINAPNLEQCGLLTIEYLSLEELCAAQEEWQDAHHALASASAETRARVARVLLDHARRELAIRVNYLDPTYQEGIRQLSDQQLRAPWALDEQEALERAPVLYPGRTPGRDEGNVYLSGWSGYGQHLRRTATFPDYHQPVSREETDAIIRQLLERLRVAGLVQVVDEPGTEGDAPGYQLLAAGLLWKAGDGARAFHDPVRMPHAPAEGGRTNPFFVEFYRTMAPETLGFEAREHTAQVPNDLRQEREKAFGEAKLPILYCSPTMELGVDIRELNLVSLRNVPPTPANYAQRSGRAGRSGQPALVFAYCSTGSSHDQYFFKRPELMVAGQVTPPRLDLANEDLLRAHLHAIWLAETGLDLGRSLVDVLEVEGDDPSLELLPSVQAALDDPGALERSRRRARAILDALAAELEKVEWHHQDWLEETLRQAAGRFDRAAERWRNLYRSARTQFRVQNQVIEDASRPPREKQQARRLRAEAEAQMQLLTNVADASQSDFYSYRYFAGEGFLPGYNFPRLPLSAFIPGRRQKDEFISRPRFLAISEFGPRAFLYHEGARYLINRVILPVREAGEEGELPTGQVKRCGRCGYLHPIGPVAGADVCERCGETLPAPLTALFRLQNVATRRLDRINCDEEERMRMGYDIISGFRFAEHHGQPSCRTARVRRNESDLARLSYGHAARLRRINSGWRRRKEQARQGFVLDAERGYWARNEQLVDDPADPMSARTLRVLPYVEDNRNCLLFEPGGAWGLVEMASLQYALKQAIQVQFQLEENELAAEALPAADDRRLILLYEAAEGGAGVLRRLLDDPHALAQVARQALALCHFDPDTGEDRRRAPRARENCEAACYDCLMNYTNQRDHALLDRQSIRPLLLELTRARVETSPSSAPRGEHLAHLLDRCDSELERRWLAFIEGRGCRLPDQAQPLIEACRTRPDFLYREQQVAVYIDGPPHDFPERQVRDEAQTDCLEDLGFLVVRFRHYDDWEAVLARWEHLFGIADT